METIKSLLDQVKKAKNVESDYALSKAMNLPKQRISGYYLGKEAPNEFVCLQIAKTLGRSFEEVMAIVRIEAEKDPMRREVWLDHLKRLGGIAASFVISFALAVTFIMTTPHNAFANQGISTIKLDEVQIMRFSRWVRRRAEAVRRMLANVLPRVCPAC